jgi:hypothetical protein
MLSAAWQGGAPRPCDGSNGMMHSACSHRSAAPRIACALHMLHDAELVPQVHVVLLGPNEPGRYVQQH